MNCNYRAENYKNHFTIVGQIIFIKNKKNDVTADMAQRENSSIKRYVSAFSNTSVKPAQCMGSFFIRRQ